MIKVLKLVIKKWFYLLIIVLPQGFGAIRFLFPDKNFAIIISDYVSENRLIIFLVTFIITLFGIIIDLNRKKETESVEEPKKVLKSLPANFELETIQKENFEWVFKVGRYFTPDSKPEEDKFIEEIDMSKTRCIKCKSEIIKGVSTGFYNRKERYAQCPNQECELNKKLVSDYELENIEEQENLKFISSVRLDFDKYWQIYCRKYNKITNGKNDEFVQPIRKLFYKL